MTPSLSKPRMRPQAGTLAATLALGFALALPNTSSSRAGDVTDKALMLFRDACLATAPAFDKAMAAAKKHGIKPQMDLGASLVGMAPDGSYSLQVRGKKECAVTAEKTASPTVAEQFRSVVAAAAGVPAASLASDGPIQITMRGQTYVVRHDRKGGEAYVIMSTAGL